MIGKHLVLAAVLGGVALVPLVDPSPAHAQSSTTGAIQGQILDASTAEPLAGVTVIVSSPVLQGAQTVFSDENGFYKIGELPPGRYLVTFYYLRVTLERSDVQVGINKTTAVFQRLKLDLAGGEIVKITDTAPPIRSDVDHAGHHARQQVLEECSDSRAHVRGGAGGRGGIAGRYRGRRVLRELVAREPVLRRRHQYDGPHVRDRRHAGDQ